MKSVFIFFRHLGFAHLPFCSVCMQSLFVFKHLCKYCIVLDTQGSDVLQGFCRVVVVVVVVDVVLLSLLLLFLWRWCYGGGVVVVVNVVVEVVLLWRCCCCCCCCGGGVVVLVCSIYLHLE